MKPEDVAKWLGVISALIQVGKLSVTDVKLALQAVRGATDKDTEAEDNAMLGDLRVYIANKYSEADALSHFGQQ